MLIYASSKNTVMETFRNVFSQISGHHGPGRLTHKINHQFGTSLVLHFPYLFKTKRALFFNGGKINIM